jgi:sec-independent protein translocase protein TatA
MFGPLGMPELVVIFVIALIVFGPRKLPELGKSLGKSLAEFKRASNELRNSLEDEIRIEEDRERAAKVAPPVVVAPPVTPEAEAVSDADEVSPQPADETTPRGAAV